MEQKGNREKNCPKSLSIHVESEREKLMVPPNGYKRTENLIVADSVVNFYMLYPNNCCVVVPVH